MVEKVIRAARGLELEVEIKRLDRLARDVRAALEELAEAAGVEVSAPEEAAHAASASNGSGPVRRIQSPTAST